MNLSTLPKLFPPNNEKKILLHVCCAVCAGDIIERMVASDLEVTLFFYNPNIHPIEEYEKRKQENKRFAQKHPIPWIDADYDVDYWFSRIKGWEQESEGGQRCKICFDVRLERSALYAFENGFKVFTSTLGISPLKDLRMINQCGDAAARRYPDITYWTHNWRKEGGTQRMQQLSKEEHFYHQEYCGCQFSFHETNQKRLQKGRQPLSS